MRTFGMLAGTVLLGSMGCGSELRETLLSAPTYEVSENCVTGPFELAVDLQGFRWGEEVKLVLNHARPLNIRYQVTLDGVKVGDMGQLVVSSAPSDACFKSARPVAEGTDVPPAPEGEVRVAFLREQPGVESLTPGIFNASSTLFSQRCERLPCDPPKKGKLKVTLWTTDPTDFTSVAIQLHHVRIEPSDETAWIKKLEADQEKSRAAARDAKAAAEADKRKWDADAPARERARKDAALAEANRVKEERKEIETLCATTKGPVKLKSGVEVMCWTTAMLKDGETYCSTHPGARYNYEGTKLVSGDRRGYAYTCKGDAPIAKSPPVAPLGSTTKPRKSPDRPPPPAKPEARPSQPSPTSRWIPGYWKWNEVDNYEWIAGTWG